MDRVQFAFLINLLLLVKYVLGDAVAYFPPEARSMSQFQFMPPQFHPVSRYTVPQYMTPHRHVMTAEQRVTQDQRTSQEYLSPILHKTAVSPVNPPTVPVMPMQGLNYTEMRDVEEDYLRAAKSEYEYPTHPAASYPSSPSYSYAPPASGYKPPASPPAPSYGNTPSHPSTVKFPLPKPDLTSLLKPVTTKVATKVSGLIGLVLSLLTGTAPDDLEMKGFKDIIINGIVRPLLIAKGGIKSLISKLTIPVISLLLINLEVLITVWWLWEECPESEKPTYTQPAYTTPTYNSYR